MSMSVTPAVRDYLATIYHLQQYEYELHVASVDLAKSLGVSAPAVARMLKRLEKLKLIKHSHYGDIELTVEGVAEASKGLRWYRILECFAFDVLNFEWDQVQNKSRQMATGMDDEIIEKMADLLGHPKLSPYGEHIPDFDQLMPTHDDKFIGSMSVGSEGIFHRIRTEDKGLRDWLSGLGVVSGVSYKITARSPFDGPMRISFGGSEQVFGRREIQAIWVKPENVDELLMDGMGMYLWVNHIEREASLKLTREHEETVGYDQ